MRGILQPLLFLLLGMTGGVAVSQYLKATIRNDISSSPHHVPSRAATRKIPPADPRFAADFNEPHLIRIPWHWCDDDLIIEYCTREILKSPDPVRYLRNLLEQCPRYDLSAEIARHVAPLLPFDEVASLAQALFDSNRIVSDALLIGSVENAVRTQGSKVLATVAAMHPPLRSDWMPHALRVLAQLKPLEAISILTDPASWPEGFNPATVSAGILCHSPELYLSNRANLVGGADLEKELARTLNRLTDDQKYDLGRFLAAQGKFPTNIAVAEELGGIRLGHHVREFEATRAFKESGVNGLVDLVNRDPESLLAAFRAASANAATDATELLTTLDYSQIPDRTYEPLGKMVSELANGNDTDLSELLNLNLPIALEKGVLSAVAIEDFRGAYILSQQVLSEGSQKEWTARTLSALASRDPEAALSALSMLGETASNPSEVETVSSLAFSSWAARDPDSAWFWLAENTNTIPRDLIVSQFQMWLGKDSFQASRFIENIADSTLRDDLAVSVSRHVILTEPGAALIWAESIQDPVKRDEAVGLVTSAIAGAR